jgi:hypothetical protein
LRPDESSPRFDCRADVERGRLQRQHHADIANNANITIVAGRQMVGLD